MAHLAKTVLTFPFFAAACSDIPPPQPSVCAATDRADPCVWAPTAQTWCWLLFCFRLAHTAGRKFPNPRAGGPYRPQQVSNYACTRWRRRSGGRSRASDDPPNVRICWDDLSVSNCTKPRAPTALYVPHNMGGRRRNGPPAAYGGDETSSAKGHGIPASGCPRQNENVKTAFLCL